MRTVADVYVFLVAHDFVRQHSESAYLLPLFADLAAGRFEARGTPPAPTESVLSCI